jgi:hypothetical protein
VRAPFVVAALVSLVFVGLCAQYLGFAMDDAFIAFRYAKNVAEGHGIVWNVSEPPVEGYTSFLWMLLSVPPIAVGLDPLPVAKLLSVVAALAIFALLAHRGARMDPWLLAVVLGVVGFSPPFALLTMQGLETTAAALVLLLLAAASIRVVDRPTGRSASLWFSLALLGGVTRPDALVFATGAFAGVIAVLVARRDGEALRRLALTAVPFVAIGGLYVAWRLHYFGHLFPNPYYIKLGKAGGLLKAEGAKYVGSFLTAVVLPYAILFGGLLIFRIRPERLLRTLPVTTGCLLFLAYLFTVDPIQGYYWRFAFPIVPAALLVAVECLADFRLPARPIARAIAASVVVVSLGWNLRYLSDTYKTLEARGFYSLREVGQRLSDLDGTMLTSAAGALPYYSNWRAADKLGLNSARIAHQGLDREFLDQLEPDLITLSANRKGKYRPDVQRHDQERMHLINEYMVERGFVAMAAIRKESGAHRHYFVRRDSALFDEIEVRLLGLDTVEYGDLERLMREPRIPIHRRGSSGKPSTG